MIIMNLKVLVIENESVIGIHIKKSLISMGHEVLMVVKNGSVALKIAQKNKIDLLIFDIDAKGDVDTIACCSKLQSYYNIPVIFITKYKDESRLKKASAINFVGHLEKPFRNDELESMVNLAI